MRRRLHLRRGIWFWGIRFGRFWFWFNWTRARYHSGRYGRDGVDINIHRTRIRCTCIWIVLSVRPLRKNHTQKEKRHSGRTRAPGATGGGSERHEVRHKEAVSNQGKADDEESEDLERRDSFEGGRHRCICWPNRSIVFASPPWVSMVKNSSSITDGYYSAVESHR